MLNSFSSFILFGIISHTYLSLNCCYLLRFCQLMAIFIYYLLSRKLQFIPYTAAVFLMGVGIGYQVSWSDSDDAILLSSRSWLTMNGQALLLLFLPGLIFLDAVTINVHLFFQAFWQLMIFACKFCSSMFASFHPANAQLSLLLTSSSLFSLYSSHGVSRGGVNWFSC